MQKVKCLLANISIFFAELLSLNIIAILDINVSHPLLPVCESQVTGTQLLVALLTGRVKFQTMRGVAQPL